MVDARRLERRGFARAGSSPVTRTKALAVWQHTAKSFQRRRCTAEVVGVTVNVTLKLGERSEPNYSEC